MGNATPQVIIQSITRSTGRFACAASISAVSDAGPGHGNGACGAGGTAFCKGDPDSAIATTTTAFIGPLIIGFAEKPVKSPPLRSRGMSEQDGNHLCCCAHGSRGR